MERRTLLRNLFSSLVAMPMLFEVRNAFGESNVQTVVEPADESHMQRAIRLAGNNPKYPFAAVLVDQQKGVVVSEGWNRSVHNMAR